MVVLSEVTALNFEVATDGAAEEWTLFDGGQERPLSQLLVEVRPRWTEATSDAPPAPHRTDWKPLNRAVAKLLWRSMVTLHERFLLRHEGVEYLLRVRETIVEEDEDEVSATDAYRGIVEAETVVHTVKDEGEFSEFFELADVPPRPAPATAVTNLVDVMCSDEEDFPVKKKLLQPCIALTKSVLAPGRPRIDASVGAGNPPTHTRPQIREGEHRDRSI